MRREDPVDVSLPGSRDSEHRQCVPVIGLSVVFVLMISIPSLCLEVREDDMVLCT